MKPQLFLKLSEQESKDFGSLMASAIMQKTLESLKDASDTGTFKFVISTDDEDRQGEKVNQAGLDFTHYMKNPVVLWGHNYGEPPVGVSTRIYRDGNKTMAEGKWAPTAFAQELRKLYDAGFLRACSIGYIPKELDENGNTQKGEVLEFSIVSIPANPFALTADTVKSLGLNLNMLAIKGMDFKIENEIKHTAPAIKADAVVGDSCQLDDGTAGIMADDGNGGMICNPIENAGMAEKPKVADPKDPDGDGDDDQGDAPNSESAEDNLHEMLGTETPKHKSYSTDAVEEFKTFAKGNSEDSKGKKTAAGKMSDKVGSEHGRHEGVVTKGLEEFTKGIEEFHSGNKAGKPDTMAKTLEKFNKDVKGEMGNHREECLKSIQEYGKKAMSEDSTDKIDNLHEKCTKAIGQSHESYAKAVDGHIEKCMKSIEEFNDGEKAAEAAKAKMGVQEELEQSDEWKAKYSKLDRVYDIFYAFTSAYMDESSTVDDFEKLLDEAVSLMKSEGTEAKGMLEKHFVKGMQKKFSKTNLETLKNALDEHEKAMSAHDESSGMMAEVHKSHKAVHAALKSLVSGPNEGGDEGKSAKLAPAAKADEGTEPADTSKTKVDKTSAADEQQQKDLESFLLNRDLLKSLAKGIGGALEKWNETHGKQRPADSRK